VPPGTEYRKFVGRILEGREIMEEITLAQPPELELSMQELEAMEAPFWATAAGVVAGAVVATAAAYGSYVVSGIVLT
jgi:hypothetical protein